MAMNVKNLDERRQLEVWAVIYFIRELRRRYRRWLRLRDFASPPDPDFYCLLNGERIGIEVAHLYGSQRDARMRLGRERVEEQTKEQRLAHSRVPLNVRVLTDLNRIIADKAEKSYGGKTWLLIRNAFPPWTRDDFEQYISEILIPEDHSFSEIWLLCDSYGSSGILRLFPR